MNLRTLHSNEIKDVRNLLENNMLPFQDITISNVKFIVAIENHEILGCIGLEQHKNDGLLRSFAVKDQNKGKGIGQNLLKELLKKSKAEGIHTIHLLTTTAEKYFTKNDFKVKPRETAPALIQKTTEFLNICPASAIYMVYQLDKTT